jgi:hypothetical protein
VLGGGVAQRVVHRLLGDAEHLALGTRRQPRAAGHAQRDVLLVDAAQHVDVLAQRGGQPLGLRRGRAQLEDQRAQLLHRPLGEVLQAGDLLARLRAATVAVPVAVEQRGGGLGGEHDPEQLLGHRVVQLAGQPVALLEDAQLAAALVQPRVLDGDRRMGGEHLDHLLVARVERVRALLLGEVEGADHPPPGDDRHPEERAHLRVGGRPPAAEARVPADVRRAQRRRVGRDHRPEHPVRARQRPHGRHQVVAHP